MRFPSLDSHLYQATLYLYPPSFREEFASEMIRDFTEAREEARQEGAKGILGFWARTGADTVATIPSQWMKSGLPIIGLISALGPLLAAACAAWFWPWQLVSIPENHPQFDIIALELFVTTVLFIVVATVLLTLWFTRQMLSPRPGPAPLAMLEAKGLTKRYGGLLALDRVSFELHPGEIVGYLGPNGSGKSTTVNMVVGLLEPSAGSIFLDGIRLSDDPEEYKRRIGYVPEDPFLYTHLTATEYLHLVGRLRGLPRQSLEDKVTALLHLFLLYDSRYKTMNAYSKGMRQRVLLASALLHNPRLLVLDEPFSGLDVNAGLLFRALLRLLADDGRMILFSTHRFDMVEKLCSRVVMLSSGKLVAEHRLADLAGQTSTLEDVFVRVTRQDDFVPTARKILETVSQT